MPSCTCNSSIRNARLRCRRRGVLAPQPIRYGSFTVNGLLNYVNANRRTNDNLYNMMPINPGALGTGSAIDHAIGQFVLQRTTSRRCAAD
jgi:hypothetical protein